MATVVCGDDMHCLWVAYGLRIPCCLTRGSAWEEREKMIN